MGSTSRWCMFIAIAFERLLKNFLQPSRSRKNPTKISPPNLQLSLEESIANIKKTEKAFIKITAKPCDTKQSPTSSKFGGIPYTTENQQIPMFKEQNMILLAQINFEEVPTIPDFPVKGLLQFFIAPILCQDWERDKNFYIQKDFYKVIWHENIQKPVAKLNTINVDYTSTPLIIGEHSLKFTKDSEYMSFCDFRFDSLVYEYFLEDIDYDFSKLNKEGYNLKVDGSGHKLGGYMSTSQGDPRKNGVHTEYELLFQIDSQFNEQSKQNEIMWGDMGTAQFLIRPEKLKECDFTDVLFFWE